MAKKFECSLSDCACEYCLLFNRKTQACRREACCRLEEKAAALARLRKDATEMRKGEYILINGLPRFITKAIRFGIIGVVDLPYRMHGAGR